MVLHNVFEFRGLEQRCSSKGNQYLIFNLEDDTGHGYAEYCGNVAYSNLGLKKGDSVRVTFELTDSKQFGKKWSIVGIQAVK